MLEVLIRGADAGDRCFLASDDGVIEVACLQMGLFLFTV